MLLNAYILLFAVVDNHSPAIDTTSSPLLSVLKCLGCPVGVIKNSIVF